MSKNTIEIKVSADNGETWIRRKVKFGCEIEESGLKPGEMFQLQGEKYKVVAGEDGLVVEQIQKPERQKSAIEKKPIVRKR